MEMTYHIKIEKFEGPLDLLLQLIEQQKMDITEIALNKVTDQYIQYIHEASSINPEELADFLLVAAKLLYLKSKEIIPSAIWEEEEMSVDLETQLKIYKEFHEASMKLEKMAIAQNFTYSRFLPLKQQVEPGFYPPRELDLNFMRDLFANVLKRLEPIISIPISIIEKTITVTEKIMQIKEAIRQSLSINFHKLLEKGNRSDVIVSFLAMLELVKQQEVDIDQATLFSDITIKRLQARDSK
ncbi:MAG: segregation/condensation protein A [Candidatus Komeilibacteria bacterium]|nr:segregation/condensation protein A [Candidatus Komeilibacteria bacterium]